MGDMEWAGVGLAVSFVVGIVVNAVRDFRATERSDDD